VEISRSRGGSTLEESVSTRLGVDPSDLAWDAYRTDDARWIVTAHHAGRPVGTWTFETVGRTVHPQDESARALMGGGPSSVSDVHEAASEGAEDVPRSDSHDAEPLPEHETATEDDRPRPRLVSVTSDPVAPQPSVSRGSEVHTTSSVHDGEQEALLEQSEVSSTPRRAKRAKGKKGRASVPSWDEILFGASRPED
jgi:hypothetical protein